MTIKIGNKSDMPDNLKATEIAADFKPVSCEAEGLDIFAREVLADHWKAALQELAEGDAFFVATSEIHPEVFARIIFARSVLDGLTIERARQKSKYCAQEMSQKRIEGME